MAKIDATINSTPENNALRSASDNKRMAVSIPLSREGAWANLAKHHTDARRSGFLLYSTGSL